MKYYGYVENSLGELALFAEGLSYKEVQQELTPLLDSGFPKQRIRILHAGSPKHTMGHFYIIFRCSDGKAKEYSIHTTNARHEFMIASEMLIDRQFAFVTSVELQDLRRHTICRTELKV